MFQEPQLVKVIGIKYEIRPPRLCGLRLAVMSDDDQVTQQNFDLKYHDITDVIDFLVLRQLYDTAMSRNWKVGELTLEKTYLFIHRSILNNWFLQAIDSAA